MRTKEGLTVLFGIFLIVTVVSVSFRRTAPETKVWINPTEETVHPTQTFTIEVDVIDVWALQAYSIIIYYQTGPMDAVSVGLPRGHFLEPEKDKDTLLSHGLYPVEGEDFDIIVKEIDDDFNITHGRVWVAARLVGVTKANFPDCKMRDMVKYYQAGRTGSGTLFTITFNCTSSGTSFLCLHQTKLSGKGGSVPHSRIHALIRCE